MFRNILNVTKLVIKKKLKKDQIKYSIEFLSKTTNGGIEFLSQTLTNPPK